MTEEEVSFVASTGDMREDACLYGFANLSFMLFPGRIRAAYLMGRPEECGTAAGAPLRVRVVFKGVFRPGEQERYERFLSFLRPLAEVFLDASVVDGAWLDSVGAVAPEPGARLLVGEDPREATVTPSPEAPPGGALEVVPGGLPGAAQGGSVLQGFVSLCELAFPGRVRAYYLLGSHAAGEAVTDSDIDMTVVFKDRFLNGERERFNRMLTCLNPLGSLSRVPLDVGGEDEARLFAMGAVNLKRCSSLLLGEDIRERVPMMPVATWLRFAMHMPFFFIERSRPLAEGEPLRYPLTYPDASGAFFGYDHREYLDEQGHPRRGIKDLINLACWLATAEVALKAGVLVASKREAVNAHREHLDDERSPLFEAVYACRVRWGHRVPEAAGDREHLRSLCARMLEAENHFLGRYRDYLLAALHGGEVLKDRVTAATRLGMVRYPGREVPEALERVLEAPEEKLRERARMSLARLQAATN